MKFKFQYDNTLREIYNVKRDLEQGFKFQYDNTLRKNLLKFQMKMKYLNSNMIIL